MMFWHRMEDNTDGDFHVLALVDGEKVKVTSVDHPDRYYLMNALDIVVVPASIGKYTIENLGCGSVTIHKTLLKK